ncbi:MAG: branched-chain amino acid ABC transporter permease [Syntrophobacterales bacterium]|nr:branched-chain amino acid ABC transporter permease [Syntrophobacterales bacterium]
MNRKNLPGFLVFLVCIGLFPVFATRISAIQHYLDVMIFGGIFGIVAIGLSLLMGYAGQISLAHAAFMGIGAYSSGILTTHFNFSPVPALFLGLLITAIIAFSVGVPSLRLKGHYLAMATLGFGVIVHIIFSEEVNWTGGPSGLVGIPGFGLGDWKLKSTLQWYYFVWLWVAVSILIALNLVNSRIGRAFRAIHEDEKAAEAMGVPTARYKVQIFVVSAAMAAFAGSLYAHYVEFINPGSFDLVWSIRFILMVMVGGIQSIWGSLLGSLFLTFLSNEWLQVFAELEILIYGIILFIISLFFPDGLFPVIFRFLAQQLERRYE